MNRNGSTGLNRSINIESACFRWFWSFSLDGCRSKPISITFNASGARAGAFQLFELPFVLFGQNSGPAGYGTTIVMYLYFMGFDTGDPGGE